MQTALEHILSTLYKEGMIEYLQSHPEDFDEAIRLALSDKQPYSWRAAWLLWSCMDEDDPRIRPYVSAIIEAIPKKNKDGHQRELIKILLQMSIPESAEGLLFDCCVSIWEGIHKRPSVRYMAFRMMLKMAQKYPDLAREMQFLTQTHYLESLSPGIKHAILLMMKVPASH